jgi:hypothetical protein
MGTRWTRCAGFSAYEVSTHGRVRQRFTKRACSIWFDPYGYATVSLQRAGRWLKPGVSLLVWRTFRGPVRPRHEIDHRDRDRANPRLSNLRELTRRRNRAWSVRCVPGKASRYRGVTRAMSGLWRARCGRGPDAHVGIFRSEIAAAMAYDAAARRRFGCCAVPNFRRKRA